MLNKETVDRLTWKEVKFEGNYKTKEYLTKSENDVLTNETELKRVPCRSNLKDYLLSFVLISRRRTLFVYFS